MKKLLKRMLVVIIVPLLVMGLCVLLPVSLLWWIGTGNDMFVPIITDALESLEKLEKE